MTALESLLIILAFFIGMGLAWIYHAYKDWHNLKDGD